MVETSTSHQKRPRLLRVIRRLARHTSAATLMEYALLASIIAIVTVAAMQELGFDISNQFVSIGSTIGR